MAKFKFHVIYMVDAKGKPEAKEIFAEATRNNTTDDFFETLIVKEVEELKGLKAHLANQFGFRQKK
jgi:hypothetical protein